MDHLVIRYAGEVLGLALGWGIVLFHQPLGLAAFEQNEVFFRTLFSEGFDFELPPVLKSLSQIVFLAAGLSLLLMSFLSVWQRLV